jgi:WD40 repeat protein
MIISRVGTVLLAGVVVTLAFTSDTAASTRRQPSPIRAVSVVPPPPGKSVYWWADSDRVTQIRAISWEGNQVGSMTFNKGVSLQDQSPDGSRLMVSDPTGLAVFTSDGRVLDFLTAYRGIWADDSRHLCAASTLDGGPGVVWGLVQPAWIFLALPGGASTPAAQVGKFSPHGGISPVACSPASDRLVVATSFITQVVSVAVYRLSDGQRLRQWQPGSLTSGARGLTQNVVASHDGRWLAENAYLGSQIREVSSGTILATVQFGHVLAFSWDGSRILVGTSNGRISVRDWRQAHDLWTACGFEPVAVRPAAADFMVGLHGPGPHELRIVDADGSVTLVVGDTLPATAYQVTPLFGC